MKDFRGSVFPLEENMMLFYDKRTKGFLAGQSLAETFYWHSGKDSLDDKIVFENGLSFNDAMSIAQIAANAAGKEIQTEDLGNVIVFRLRQPQ